MPQRTTSTNLIVLLVTIVFCVSIAEIALRIFTPYPVGDSSNKAADPDLGYRLSSDFPQADAAGFRNSASAPAEVLAIGDSHTYGNNVGPKSSWPAVLTRNSGLQIYNAGMGSYGILTYHALLTSQCLPKARAAIIALYLANDISGGGSDGQIIADPSPFWQREASALGLVWPERKRSRKEFKGYSLIDRLRTSSAIIGNVRAVIDYKQGMPPGEPFYEFPDGVQPILVEHVVTHDNATNLKNPDVATMLDNLERMAATWSRQEAVKVGVMIVPARERVVYAYFEKQGRLGELAPDFVSRLQNLIEMEKRCIQILSACALPYREALPEVLDAFESELRAGRSIYPGTGSGHPLEAGYASYAAAAFALLHDMGITALSR
jgi:hypothetical protein